MSVSRQVVGDNCVAGVAARNPDQMTSAESAEYSQYVAALALAQRVSLEAER